MSKDFEPFTGDYEKQHYDVRAGGEIIEHCWPNAGFMVATDGSGRQWAPGECECRVSATHPMDAILAARK